MPDSRDLHRITRSAYRRAGRLTSQVSARVSARMSARMSSRPSAVVRAEVERLRRRGTRPALALVEALTRAGADDLDPHERGWVDAIERRRAAQYRCRATISWKQGRQVPLGRIARRASQPRAGGVLLLCLVRAFQPRQALELGTCAGFSAAYQGAGLQLNGAGELVTLEAYPDLAGHASAMWDQLRLTTIRVEVGRFEATLPGLLGPELDHVFVDGAHHGPRTYAHFRAFAEVARPGALLIFDDIAWSDEMAQAWLRIRDDACVAEHATTGTLGMVVLGEA